MSTDSHHPSEDDAALLRWLEHHDERCPACRYDLRRLTATACPECGTRLRLGVAAPQLNLSWWLLAIISFALALGFDGVVTVLMTVAILVEGPPPALVWLAYAAFITLALACAGAVLALFRLRARWFRIPLRRQRLLAVAIFLAVGAAHAIYALILIPF